MNPKTIEAKARQLLEAIELGDLPDFIDPEKRRRIERGEHPYAKTGGFPEGTYAEQLATRVYPEIVQKIQHYTGRLPRSPRELGPLVGQMMQAIQQRIPSLERAHRPQLEQAAVNILLELPEYASLKRALKRGDLRIKAELIAPSREDKERMKLEPGEEEEQAEPEEGLEMPEMEPEADVEQALGQVDAEKGKRRVINMLIQGSAMTKHYAFNMAADLLNRISPELLNLYGTVQSVSELLYWATPDEQWRMMMGSGTPGGLEELTVDDEGVPTIHAKAGNFALLIHELAKGMAEYLAYQGTPEAQAARQEVDVEVNEPWDIMVGRGAYKDFLAALGHEHQHLAPHIFSYLASLPAEEFNPLMKEILAQTPAGKRRLAELVRQAQELEDWEREQEEAGEEGPRTWESLRRRRIRERASGIARRLLSD
jgi:hypothetical protein